MDQVKIGKYIAEKRKSLDMTQVQLAEQLGMSDKSVSKWERGVCLPDVSVYKPLCDALGIWLNEKEDLKAEFRKRIRGNVVLAIVVLICGVVLIGTVCDAGAPLAITNIDTSWTALNLGNSIWMLRKYKRII